MSKRPPTRILIVDDHPVVRKGMAQIIEEHPDLQVVAQAGSGEAALALAEKLNIDVAVADIDMPGMSGLELAERLGRHQPPIGVVLVTMLSSEQIFNSAMDAGVSAYILKDEAEENIADGIRHAARGEPYVTPSLMKYLMRRSRRAAAFDRETTGFDSLTPTELKVLVAIARERTTKEIAAELFISPRTVDTHRSNICEKLQLTGSNPLLPFALKHRSEILGMATDGE